MRPEVLLYDEPTTGLDPVNINRIIDLILHLQRTLKITSVVVTHDMHTAIRVSNRIAMIDKGGIIFSGDISRHRHLPGSRVKDFIEGNAAEEPPRAAQPGNAI
jgi:phospholipid/cholesterol/gamma-HCH transport system ATP-binding protein